MATVIRAEISEKNKYWISKHRHYELKHFCLQYPEWKRAYREACNVCLATFVIDNIMVNSNEHSDLTAKYAIKRVKYAENIKLIERIAKETDEDLYPYLLKAVTEGYSYTYLKTLMDIPCGKDMYYNRYRKFFWLLSNSRN